MKKAFLLISLTIVIILSILSCNKKDDGATFIPPRERADEVGPSTEEIELYLNTHFYNYDDFETPPADFNYRIVFDTIAGDNANKTRLIDQVEFKEVNDRIDESVSYKLYFLKVRQGGGKAPKFSDIVSTAYNGFYLNNDPDDLVSDIEFFDGSVIPANLDLTSIVPGLQEVLVEFNASESNTIQPDGTVIYENFGIGAAFIPGGLGYYAAPPASIPSYSQLVFTFQVMEVELGDQDDDTVPSYLEDLNGDGSVFDDDTDGDIAPNFADGDDDGDGRFTKNEVTINEYTVNPGDDDPVLASNEVEINRDTDSVTSVITITTITFTDQDGDGTPDYLDKDN